MKISLRTLAVFSLLFFTSITAISAQRTATFFQKTYKPTQGVVPDTSSMSFQSVAKTADGGYGVFANYENRRNLGDIAFLRMDSLGNVKWSIDLRSDTTENATGMRVTPDGGFILCGWNASPTDFSKGEMLLTKITATGNIAWGTQFGGEDVDEAGDVAVLNNGNIMVVGRSPQVVGGSYNGYFLLTSATGVPDNGQYLTFGNAPASLNSVDKTADGGAIASGYGGSLFQPTSFDPIMVKFNSLGNVVWGKRYATAGTQFNNAVKQTRDLGYITMGQQAVTVNGNISQTFYVIKTNANGDTTWCKAYDTGKFEFAKSIVEVGEGYIVSGYATVGVQNIIIKGSMGQDSTIVVDLQNSFSMKIDLAGNVKWGKLYGDSTKTGRSYSSTLGYDNGVTVVGETFGYGNKFGAGFMYHIDQNGNIGAGVNCQIRPISFTASTFRIKDSTNVLTIEGGDERTNNLRRDTLSTTTTAICTGTGLNTTGIAAHLLPENSVKIYPNPAQNTLFIENTEGGNETTNIQIFDVTGGLIQSFASQNDVYELNVSHFAQGIYMVKIIKDGRYLVKKFIVD